MGNLPKFNNIQTGNNRQYQNIGNVNNHSSYSNQINQKNQNQGIIPNKMYYIKISQNN